MSSSLKMHQAQVYRLLKSLERRGIVEQTLEAPTLFTAIPFENLLDAIIRAKREEGNTLEAEKDELLGSWKFIVLDQSPTLSERFMVVEGRSNIYSRIYEFLERTEREFLVLTTELGVIRCELAELFEAVITRATVNRGIRGRILSPITSNKVKITRQIIETVTVKKLDIHWRHIHLVSKIFSRFVIKDEEEVLFFISPVEDSTIENKKDTGLWTNSRAFTYAQKAFFQELWRNGTDPCEKIHRIEQTS